MALKGQEIGFISVWSTYQSPGCLRPEQNIRITFGPQRVAVAITRNNSLTLMNACTSEQAENMIAEYLA